MSEQSARLPQLVSAVWRKKVQLVTDYNDREDIRIGGPEILGPYRWVVEEYVPEVVRKITDEYGDGKDSRVIEIDACDERRLWPCDQVPSLDEEIAQFMKYLSDPEKWRSG